ncbi:chemotaxis protein CheC [Piscibacillus halophilus]|uniref:Chemotaxis protein CheC n=1 Tax=Piscibacillus halophilus TaxID=571933 RepID=A0A1H8Z054_9BACI|nr:chemotaxis protein CheC [Piscibacillus halophilus]SEP57743.1 chemotaxis protein CheC [Piscibacillus halophilus]
MGDLFNLKNIHLDLLKEVGNIGAGNATTSLSNLLSVPVQMSVPTVKVVSFDEMVELTGGPEEVMATTFLEFSGDFTGNVFFFISPDQADQFVQILIQDEQQSILNDDQKLAHSAFLELGNILTGSYLRALSDFLQVNLYAHVPNATVDMAGAIMTQGLIETSVVSDYSIIIETVFQSEHFKQDIKGHFFLLPDPGAFEKIFDRLGVK